MTAWLPRAGGRAASPRAAAGPDSAQAVGLRAGPRRAGRPTGWVVGNGGGGTGAWAGVLAVDGPRAVGRRVRVRGHRVRRGRRPLRMGAPFFFGKGGAGQGEEDGAGVEGPRGVCNGQSGDGGGITCQHFLTSIFGAAVRCDPTAQPAPPAPGTCLGFFRNEEGESAEESRPRGDRRRSGEPVAC